MKTHQREAVAEQDLPRLADDAACAAVWDLHSVRSAGLKSAAKRDGRARAPPSGANGERAKELLVALPAGQGPPAVVLGASGGARLLLT